MPKHPETEKPTMSWFAAHLVMYIKLKDRHQDRFPLWENVVLIKADSEDEAFEKATRRGHDEEGDEEGSLRWGGRPAQWVFAGVRKLTSCEDAEKRPNDGTEVTFIQMEVDSTEAIAQLVGGEPMSVRLAEKFKAAVSEP
jgi:hypothetical protein